MQEIKEVFEFIKDAVRFEFRQAVKWLNRASNGKVTSDAVMIFGLLMHVPIAILIARGRFIWAAVLLIIFSVFGMMHDELARTQKQSSEQAKLLDATVDRIKEVMLYSGAGFFLAASAHPTNAVWAVIACGAVLTVHYVKARSETVVASSRKIISHTVFKRLFSDDLSPFEIRMLILSFGLAVGQLFWAIVIISLLAILMTLRQLLVVSNILKK